MDIIGVYDECPSDSVVAELGHPVKVDKQRQKDIVRGGAVLEDSEEICLQGNGGDVSGMESEGSGGSRYGVLGSGGESMPYRRSVCGVYQVHVAMRGARSRACGGQTVVGCGNMRQKESQEF